MNAPLHTPLRARPPSEAQDALYLGRLGDRVRAWRNAHGMSRRLLAESSCGSELYRAQLEAGRGNISVLLLRRVARAMRVTVEQLVREEPAARSARIALLGRSEE